MYSNILYTCVWYMLLSQTSRWMWTSCHSSQPAVLHCNMCVCIYIYIRYYTIIYVQYVNDCIIIDIILREFRKPKKMLPVWSKSKLLCPSCFVELCIQPCQASKYWRAEKRATPQSIWSHAIWPICREVCGCSCCQFQCWAFQLISRCGAAAQHMCFSRPSRRTSGRILSLALKRRSSKLLQRLQER